MTPGLRLLDGLSMQALRRLHTTAARRGVTLIEMVLVFVLVGILAGLAIPIVNAPGFRADAEARNTRTVLEMAQRLAITHQYDVVVSFDTIHMQIRVLEDTNNNNVADAGERVTWHAFEYGMKFATPPAGLNGTTATSSITGRNLISLSGMPSIVFLRSGSASTDAQIYLTSPRSYTNDYRGITVTQSTGRTTYSRYLHSIWTLANI
jgi:prepilin-type N-terminal cleavage/methylation domain-containing protein